MQQGLPKVLARHCGIQLAILLVYATGLFIYGKTSSPNYAEFVAGMMIVVSLHALICGFIGIISFIRKRIDLVLATGLLSECALPVGLVCGDF